MSYVTENVLRAYDDIDELIKSAGRGQEQAPKVWKDDAQAALRDIRDALSLHCRSQAEPGDRGAFLVAAEKAFGRPLDRELRAVLLLAYHKVAKGLLQADADAWSRNWLVAR